MGGLGRILNLYQFMAQCGYLSAKFQDHAFDLLKLEINENLMEELF